MWFFAKRSRVIAGLAVLLLATAIGYQALGAVMAAGQPTAVVTVNLGAVLEKLHQRDDADRAIKLLAESMRADDEKHRADLAKMEADLKAATDSAAKEELQEQFALAMLKYQAWARFTSEKMDIESALRLEDLYRSIKTALAQMAVASKFDVVLIDDSQGELSTNPEAKLPREAQIRQQIAGRRLLYVNPTIDITDALIVRMNNEYKTTAKKTP